MILATLLAARLVQANPGFHRAGKTVVLTYHDVIETRDGKDLWFDCTATELSSQLDWMQARGVHFITVDQLYRHLAQGDRLPAKPVAVTFADNYEGFWERGYPVLKKRQIPVAMFVHTGFVGDTHGRPMMTWDQLRILDRDGLVTIASQTVTHPNDLGKLSIPSIRKELTQSKAKLEKELGHPILYLAYPNGRFSPECERLAREAGYRMAFSEVTRPVEASPSFWAVNRYVHTKYRAALGN